MHGGAGWRGGGWGGSDATRRIVVADDPRCNTGGVNGSQRCRRCLISPHALPFKMNPSTDVGALETGSGPP